MATFTSKASGVWTSAGQTTWNESGTPGDSDTVQIGAHAITGQPASAASVTATIANGGSLTCGSTLNLTSCTVTGTGALNWGEAGSHLVNIRAASTPTAFAIPGDTGQLLILSGPGLTIDSIDTTTVNLPVPLLTGPGTFTVSNSIVAGSLGIALLADCVVSVGGNVVTGPLDSYFLVATTTTTTLSITGNLEIAALGSTGFISDIGTGDTMGLIVGGYIFAGFSKSRTADVTYQKSLQAVDDAAEADGNRAKIQLGQKALSAQALTGTYVGSGGGGGGMLVIG